MYAFSGSLLAAVLCSNSFVHGQAIYPVTVPDSSAPAVDLGYAKYQGYTDNTTGIDYFRGLQYAANPTGLRRWQEPAPIASNNNFTKGVLYNATVIAPACYQSQPLSDYEDSGDTYVVSEDCLIVDVLVPHKRVSKSLAVVVQIHGGGYTEGSAQDYPGDAMVHASKGSIIYVSMQYRLGIFGFLGGIGGDGTLNAGLLDQRAALEWVQQNIHAFGGNPDMVTIWGGSAGGGSVSLQLTAGASDKPPFSAAIPAYPFWQPLLNSSEQKIQYSTTLRLSGCSNTACLRGLSPDQLGTLGQKVENASYLQPGYGFGVFYFGPVVDGKFVQTLPGLAFQQGKFYDVPLLIDHDAYEGVDFSNDSQTNQIEETADAEVLFPFAGRAFFSRLYQLYPAKAYNSTFWQRQSWFGDFIINCPTYYMAYNAVERNRNASAVFKMVFAAGGGEHGASDPYLNPDSIDWSGVNRTLGEIMTSYWISFAVSHDPNPMRNAKAPFWPSYVDNGKGSIADGQSVGFSTLEVTDTTIYATPDLDADGKCEFFGNNGYNVMN